MKIWNIQLILHLVCSSKTEYWYSVQVAFVLIFFQAFSVVFIFIAFTSDMICLLFIPVHWLFFAASTYVWVQFVWHTGMLIVRNIGRWRVCDCTKGIKVWLGSLKPAVWNRFGSSVDDNGSSHWDEVRRSSTQCKYRDWRHIMVDAGIHVECVPAC